MIQMPLIHSPVTLNLFQGLCETTAVRLDAEDLAWMLKRVQHDSQLLKARP